MQSQQVHHEDEIDLVELIAKFAQQWKAFCFAILIALMVAVPVYVVTPIQYKVSYFHQPLQPDQVRALLSQEYLALTRADINDRFYSAIKTPALIEQALRKQGLLDEQTAGGAFEQANVVNSYAKAITIQKFEESFVQDTATLRGVEIALESANVVVAQETLNKLLLAAENYTIDTLMNEISGLRQLELDRLERLVSRLTIQAGYRHAETIERLRVALNVAQELGIEEGQLPSYVAADSPLVGVRALPEDALYLLGTKALNQMLVVLQDSKPSLYAEELKISREGEEEVLSASQVLAAYDSAEQNAFNGEGVYLLPDSIQLNVEGNKISLWLALVVALFLGVMLGAVVAIFNIAKTSYRERVMAGFGEN